MIIYLLLFDDGAELAAANIAEIKITRDGVIAIFKDPSIAMYCPEAALLA